jgi:hypothetical protein
VIGELLPKATLKGAGRLEEGGLKSAACLTEGTFAQLEARTVTEAFSDTPIHS